MKINKKIEKGTHSSICSLLFNQTNNVAYLVIKDEFSTFITTNNFTYITACHYLIDEFNELRCTTNK